MNDILQLKGKFEKRDNPNKPGSSKLKKNEYVTEEHITTLISQLKRIHEYWTKNRDIDGALISVHYNKVVAKTNRIQILLSDKGLNTTDSIRGAKFKWDKISDNKTQQKHVFTHYVPLSAIENTLNLLSNARTIIINDYNYKITSDDTENIATKKIYNKQDIMARTTFLKVIVDCSHVEKFDIDYNNDEIQTESIITIYKTNINTKELLQKFGINILDNRIINDTTLKLYHEELQLLQSKAPYLIAMALTDFREINDDYSLDTYEPENTLIPSPTNEPIVGVIDTQFNEEVYFSEWVEYINMLTPDIELEKSDYYHGTSVSSIIVDGPRANPKLDDECGRFRVKHFGVATHNGFSSFGILKMIREIVSTNRNIKVWNLSLGSKTEIPKNFISPEGAELDNIQTEYDVIFIIAGTNKADNSTSTMRIGSPADSLNSLVVNSVSFNNTPASYTRVGPVLSFFQKPDISYYGGDGRSVNERIAVCRDSLGAQYVVGTSYAAPWITRKMAYLIYNLGLNREIAKALLIDSAAGWERKDNSSGELGYGIVPIKINDIVKSQNDEIKFYLSGSAEDFETYTYNLPVPIAKGKHPYFAKATLVYFPQCNRNQGVDYTNTEMDIHFGRIKMNPSTGKTNIKSINNNKQSDEGKIILYEESARSMYRKWDNVKHISEKINPRAKPREVYDSGLWGLSIKTKERLQPRNGQKLNFGVVITLKEMNGVNRINDFIKACIIKGWIVNRLDIQNQIDIYSQAEEEINFE